MNSKVTIVMYHYVRDIHNSRFPKIRGLETKLFKEQIAYFKKHYSIITMEELICAIDKNISLPPKSLLLTFDDGYIDHYTNVFPILVQNGIQGSFFPPARAITENIVLDVNKIHFTLAACNCLSDIVRDSFELLNRYREQFDLKSNDYYYNKLAKKTRFDEAETIFVKRLLQVELPEYLRSLITNILFEKYVGIPEVTFSRELYLNVDQLKIMKQFGMHIGSHGFNHYWLNSLAKKEQDNEVKESIIFLNKLGIQGDYWTMCYPYGAFNDDTICILSENKSKLALTTNVGIADFKNENRFSLSRLDTNDFPKHEFSLKNEWYAKG
jgi:peptidoglycan/xylan/chitin deacetylase (PgdA/CDA1 family)